jgi:hypothetical protein
VTESRDHDGGVPGAEDQRRLHGWPGWDESVRRGRRILKFDPGWTPRPGEPQSPEYVRWRHTTELIPLLAEANRALIDLHLPDSFRDYWIACFLAPYERDGFEAIRDPQPNGDVVAKRVYPPPPELWFTAGIDYSNAPYLLVIEGPAALASSVVLRAAVRRALESKRRSGLAHQHPLMRSRQIGPAAEDRAADRDRPNPARAKAIRHARALAAAGEKPEFIAKSLARRGYVVSARTIRRWVDGQPDGKSDTPSGQNEGPMANR